MSGRDFRDKYEKITEVISLIQSDINLERHVS